jgi:hypothetical protein
MNKIVSRSLVCAAACAALLSAAAPPASAYALAGACTAPGLVEICVTEVRTTGVGQALYAVEPGQTFPVARVAGYLDTYQFGSTLLPCITPVVNDAEVDACRTLNLGVRVDRKVLVPAADITVSVSQLEEHGSVYVCEATLRVLVAGFGESGRTIFTACGSDLPQFVN